MAVINTSDAVALIALTIAQTSSDIFSSQPEAALVVDNGNGCIAVEYGGLFKCLQGLHDIIAPV